jgi:hypothetical protein
LESERNFIPFQAASSQPTSNNNNEKNNLNFIRSLVCLHFNSFLREWIFISCFVFPIERNSRSLSLFPSFALALVCPLADENRIYSARIEISFVYEGE